MKEQYKHYRVNRPLGLAASATAALAIVASIPALASANPAASVGVDHHTLTIRGTGSADTVVIDFSNTGSVLVSSDGGAPAAFDRAAFDAVAVTLGAGDDVLRTTSGGTALTDLPMTVDAGAGADAVTGGAANDDISGGAGGDRLVGGAGTDVVAGDSGSDFVDGGVGADTELLGAGDDTAAWDPGEGNDVIAGDSGADTLVFNGSDGDERMSLSANGSEAVFLRSLGSIRMDLAGVEQVKVAARGGVDTVTVDDLSGTDVSSAVVDLGASTGGPDTPDDTVVVNGTDGPDRIAVRAEDGAVSVSGLQAQTVVRNAGPTDRLEINGLGGFDRSTVDDDVTTILDLVLDLGTDQL